MSLSDSCHERCVRISATEGFSLTMDASSGIVTLADVILIFTGDMDGDVCGQGYKQDTQIMEVPAE